MTIAERKRIALTRLEAALRVQDKAKAENRSLTVDERTEIAEARAEAASLKDDVEHGDIGRGPARRQTDTNPRPGSGGDYEEEDPLAFKTKSGERIRAYRHGEKVFTGRTRSGDRVDAQEINPFKMIRYLATGRREFLSDYQMRTLSSTSNTAGGFIVDDQTASFIIDRARNKSVLMQAGAVTIPFTGSSLTIGRFTGTPSFQMKAENEAFTEGGITFDAINLEGMTFGSVFYGSREFYEDAANAEAEIERFIVNEIATAWDNIGINGVTPNGSRPSGIVNHSQVQTTDANTGTLAWADVSAALEDCLDFNGTPDVYLTTPALNTALDLLASGDGATSAELWQGPPLSVSKLTRMVSNQVPSGTVIVGGIRDNVVLGLRQEARIEVTTTGGDTFAKHQIGIKVVLRGDWNIMHGEQIALLKQAT